MRRWQSTPSLIHRSRSNSTIFLSDEDDNSDLDDGDDDDYNNAYENVQTGYGGARSKDNRELRRASPGAETSADASQTEICIHSLRDRCAFGKVCRKHHKNLPYQWQYRQAQDGGHWLDFAGKGNMDLELNYSQVEKGDCYVPIP